MGKGASGRHKPGSRTRVTGYHGKSGWVASNAKLLAVREAGSQRAAIQLGKPFWGAYSPQLRLHSQSKSPLPSINSLMRNHNWGNYTHLCEFPTAHSPMCTPHWGSAHSPAQRPRWGIYTPQRELPTDECTLPSGGVLLPGECTLLSGDSPPGECTLLSGESSHLVRVHCSMGLVSVHLPALSRPTW